MFSCESVFSLSLSLSHKHTHTVWPKTKAFPPHTHTQYDPRRPPHTQYDTRQKHSLHTHTVWHKMKAFPPYTHSMTQDESIPSICSVVNQSLSLSLTHRMAQDKTITEICSVVNQFALSLSPIHTCRHLLTQIFFLCVSYTMHQSTDSMVSFSSKNLMLVQPQSNTGNVKNSSHPSWSVHQPYAVQHKTTRTTP